MARRFSIMDVFTDRPLAGNQLGVIHDCEGLDTSTMQAIAREFNFAETIFLSAPQNPDNAAKVRIFTPANELPFAGHPTVGAAICVAHANGMADTGQKIVLLEENIGPVRCAVRFDEGAPHARFDLPLVAKPREPYGTRETAAAALGLDVDDIGFDNHVFCGFDGGLPYDFVPVRDLGAVSRATPQMQFWRAGFGDHVHNSAYVYCRETVGGDVDFHARMFAPDAGIPEDPATGSAVAAFAGVLVRFEDPPPGSHIFQVEQGIEMGRPSVIELEIDIGPEGMTGGRIGGHAVFLAHGHLDI